MDLQNTKRILHFIAGTFDFIPNCTAIKLYFLLSIYVWRIVVFFIILFCDSFSQCSLSRQFSPFSNVHRSIILVTTASEALQLRKLIFGRKRKKKEKVCGVAITEVFQQLRCWWMGTNEPELAWKVFFLQEIQSWIIAFQLVTCCKF